MNTTLPPILEEKLAHFRSRVWTVKLAEAILAGWFGLVVSYLTVFTVDRVWETPAWIRLCILIAGAATLFLGVPYKWHRWVWKQRRLEDAARLLRHTFPQLGDQLLGIVELSRADHGAAGRSERLVQAAIAQTADAVKDQNFTHAVPNARHRAWAWAATGAFGLSALAFIFVNGAARNALARWAAPLANLERFTFVRVEPLPSRLVVPYAESFEFAVRLSAGSKWSPGEGSGRIGAQSRVTAKLRSGSYRLGFPPQKQDEALWLWVGDVRKRILIEPRMRPELAKLAVRLRLPGYLGYRSEPRIELRGGSISVLKGSLAAFEARASRTLASAELDGKPQSVSQEKVITGYETVNADAERKFTWKDQDGLTPREPLLVRVLAVEDDAPKIVARRESLEQVVLDSEVVTVDLMATDDFGVKRAGLEWIGSLMKEDGKTPITGEKISAAGGPEKRELNVRATFCAKREGVAPQTLEIRGWTEDYLKGRKHSRSAAFVLHILNKTDHALWLTEQFGKWLDAARETYDREQQLHQTNKELRALSAAELDRPENRRRVSPQAAAENANASRLESLNQSGTSLVEQATKNDEFDARRLESWATMLKALKDIAGNRMPTVADLLKQTASAAAGKPGGASPPEAKPAAQTAKPGGGKLGLPGTTLGAAPNQKPDEAKPPESQAQHKLDTAIQEQKDLLAEFAKVSDRLGEILASLEASTFVKRFKAASRQQMNLATSINEKTLDAFGIEKKPVKAAEPIATRAKEQSEIVRVIQSDMDAYFDRKQDSRYKVILDEMKKTEIVRALAREGDKVAINLSGQSLNASEFWADTLDRWAEELVAASNCKSSTCRGGDSLPPEIVLKVMQALRDEIKLRDETREEESAKAALGSDQFLVGAKLLAEKQGGIATHTGGALSDILALPEGAAKFGKEVQLLNAVLAVMDETKGILGTPETGPKAIAAETEAIELLLQTKRMSPKGGGGGGGGASPGGGGRAGSASSSALADLGPGSDANKTVTARPVGQATGRSGKEFPEEFKPGLDAYFNALEGQDKR